MTGRNPRTSSTPNTRTLCSSSEPPRCAEPGTAKSGPESLGAGPGGCAFPRAGAAPGLGPGSGARYCESGITLYFSNKASRLPPPVSAGPGAGRGLRGRGRERRGARRLRQGLRSPGGGAAPARCGASVGAARAGGRARVRGARCPATGGGAARPIPASRLAFLPQPRRAASGPAERRCRHGQVSPARPRAQRGPGPGSAPPRAPLAAPPCPGWCTTESGAAARAPPALAARSSRRPTRRTCASSTRVSGAVAAGRGARGLGAAEASGPCPCCCLCPRSLAVRGARPAQPDGLRARPGRGVRGEDAEPQPERCGGQRHRAGCAGPGVARAGRGLCCFCPQSLPCLPCSV